MSVSVSPSATRSEDERADSGALGNHRLTSATGIVLILMLAVEGYTILDVEGLITLHIVLGIMLVGPVLLKVGTTLYRFVGYYTGRPAYVRKGPPHIVLRILGPLVTISSLAVLGTGLSLLAVHNRDSWVLTAHQASFIVWVSAMTIHVLGHVREAATASWDEVRARSPQRRLRLAALVLALLVGVGGAVALLPSASSWTSHHGDAGHHRFDRH
jgi:hypothetical protein